MVVRRPPQWILEYGSTYLPISVSCKATTFTVVFAVHYKFALCRSGEDKKLRLKRTTVCMFKWSPLDFTQIYSIAKLVSLPDFILGSPTPLGFSGLK